MIKCQGLFKKLHVFHFTEIYPPRDQLKSVMPYVESGHNLLNTIPSYVIIALSIR